MAPKGPYWLQEIGDDGEPGPRVKVKPGGSFIGRGDVCEIGFPADERAIHREHAFIKPTRGGLAVEKRGTNPVLVNGEPIGQLYVLTPGDVLGIGRFRLEVVGPPPVDAASPREPERPSWLLSGYGDSIVRIAPRLSVGGGALDDLRIDGWPESALVFYEADGTVVLDARAPVWLEGRSLSADAIEELRSGDRVRFRDTTLQLLASTGGSGATTIVEAADAPPRALTLVWEPDDSGRLIAQYAHVTKEVQLATKRARLLEILMDPPDGFHPGETVPDKAVVEHVWRDVPYQGRLSINTLLRRLRIDLLEKNINARKLLLKGGGGVRLDVSEGTQLEVVPY